MEVVKRRSLHHFLFLLVRLFLMGCTPALPTSALPNRLKVIYSLFAICLRCCSFRFCKVLALVRWRFWSTLWAWWK